MPIADRITPSSVQSYARAAIEVARVTMRLWRHDGFEALVVPSRGAVPVVRAANLYTQILSSFLSRRDRLKLLRAEFRSPLSKVLHLPFTADAGPIGLDWLTTADVRRFWTRVLVSIAHNDINSPSYRFHRFTRDNVCSIGHHDNYERFVRSRKFIFIDTVVSGRAVAEISEAFEKEGLVDSHFILLLDENGARLRNEYAIRLRQLENAGRATLIRLESLFTEDQGPAVSGVWSVVAPAMMEVACNEVPAFADGIIGSGLYYHEVRAREDKSNLNVTVAIARLSTILFQAIQMMSHGDAIAEDLDLLGLNFKDARALDRAVHGQADAGLWLNEVIDEYLEHVTSNHLFDKSCTLALARPRLLLGANSASGVDISSSHCLRLDIRRDEAAKLVRQFKSSLARPIDPESS